MEEKEASTSCVLLSEERSDSLYQTYFSVSCAFIALRLISKSVCTNRQSSEVRDKLLQGSSVHLLGFLHLLVWRIQSEGAVEGWSELLYRLKKVQTEVEELKKRRIEDAKANEKVVSIFASQEQSWFSERKMLKQQISNLLNTLRAQKTKEDEIVLSLNEKVQDKELLIQSRDKALEDAEAGRKEFDEKLQRAEALSVELRESMKKEAQKHASELCKHKTAFIELVSNQRQLEADMGRALRQVEAAKQELDSVIKQKAESNIMVQQLSLEVVKMRKDSEQKDKILSAMLRKLKLDTEEKRILQKELKNFKTKRKQAQFEMEKYRALYESTRERHTSRSILLNKMHSRSETFSEEKGLRSIEVGYTRKQMKGAHYTANKNKPRTLLIEYMEADEHAKEWDCYVPEKTLNMVSDSLNQYTSERRQSELITTDVKQLQGWIHSETERNTIILEQRHQMEIDVFAEQLRLKDEKLEALHWRLLSMEQESKRLQSHIEGLNKTLSHLRNENMKLQAMLLNRKAELRSSNNGNASWIFSPKDIIVDHTANWSEVRVIKTKPGERPKEVDYGKEEQIPIEDCAIYTNWSVEAPAKDIEVEKEVTMDTGHGGKPCVRSEEPELVTMLESDGLVTKNTSSWKEDLHSLGVSYNIKRLKQQLLLLDKLVGMPQSCKDRKCEDTSHFGTKGFVVLMSLINKQLRRYQSLQEKIDDLQKRMVSSLHR
ncbi:Alanine--trna ligase [Thalictrum thalictroides]|uniref:Alanine--trna ligase n=1 Tax=Thalictrum thalictroides TaxID=46969 RepID=A0A7J6WIU1_THATH|nr:Alanine--trna ligase [Thalictrum thalictroides]